MIVEVVLGTLGAAVGLLCVWLGCWHAQLTFRTIERNRQIVEDIRRELGIPRHCFFDATTLHATGLLRNKMTPDPEAAVVDRCVGQAMGRRLLRQWWLEPPLTGARPLTNPQRKLQWLLRWDRYRLANLPAWRAYRKTARAITP